MSKKLRPIRIEGNIAYVVLTQGKEAVIDAEKAEIVGQWNWFAIKNKNNFYAARHSKSREKLTLLHRFIYPIADSCILDHINGDGLNNMMRNLRIATPAQNAQNSRRLKGEFSYPVGVSLRDSGLWRARISVLGKCIHLGYFQFQEDAKIAYQKASIEMHGEFSPFA